MEVPAEEEPTAAPTQPPTEEPAPTEVPPSATPEPELPTAAPEPVTAQPQPPTPAPADATALLQEHCTACHSLDRVAAKSESLAEWAQIVARMVAKGAALDQAEAALLVEYLAQNYGE